MFSTKSLLFVLLMLTACLNCSLAQADDKDSDGGAPAEPAPELDANNAQPEDTPKEEGNKSEEPTADEPKEQSNASGDLPLPSVDEPSVSSSSVEPASADASSSAPDAPSTNSLADSPSAAAPSADAAPASSSNSAADSAPASEPAGSSVSKPSSSIPASLDDFLPPKSKLKGFSAFPGDKLIVGKVPRDGRKLADCPEIHPEQQRNQLVFQAMVRSVRKQLYKSQPWKAWARKILSCTLGKVLYESLSLHRQIKTLTETTAVLKNEYRSRSDEAAEAAIEAEPCHPFAAERARLKALLTYRKALESPSC